MCSRHYVDGGIFDNAPVGLAIDLTESTYRAALLQPVNYLFVDPDLRRLSPAGGTAPQARPRAAGLERVLRLLGELAATGRSSDLSRTVRASGWNRTTSRLLYRTVAALVPFFSLNQQLGALATGAAFPPVPEGILVLLPQPLNATTSQMPELMRSMVTCGTGNSRT